MNQEELVFKKPRYSLDNIDYKTRDDGFAFAIEILDKEKKEISVILFQSTHGWEWFEDDEQIRILRPMVKLKKRKRRKKK